MPNQTSIDTTYEARRRPEGMSISVKLFAYLALFTFFILVVVWTLQIGLLNYFYKETKYKELEMTDRAYVNTLRENVEQLPEVVDEFSAEYDICTRIFLVDFSVDGNGAKAYQIASVDVSGDCLIHHMSDKFLTYLYNQASQNGGVYTYDIGVNEYALNNHIVEPSKNPGDYRDNIFHKVMNDSVNSLRIRLVTDAEDQEYIIMLNSELAPLSATVETLKTQFWMIAVILLMGALFLAVLISRNISRPIQKMNQAAKRLATGQYDADFEVTGYREVMELSDSLTHASEELSKNDRLQKELIANISHDLRTPLTMIIGYSEVMRDLPEENTPENVQVIIDETRRLADLVNDLLDLSKLQAGTRKMTMTRFDLTSVVQSVMARYEKLTQKDGYDISFVFDTQVDVVADQTMILQVVYNLINNAINYTGDDKKVKVTQQVIPETGRVRISVIDSGVGIPADQIPLIWDRYYKVDKVHRRAMVGTGLGLSIVKHILEQHNTTYGVESKLGVGSTFWFELDVAQGE